MKKSILFLLITLNIYSQSKKDLFVGIELGSNTIISYKLNEPKNSLQQGLSLEYFFDKYASISTRIKYFKTGLSFDNSSDPSFGQFNGSVISIPLNMNINIIEKSKIYPTLNLGLAYNYETESKYSYKNNYSKSFVSINLGVGVNYKLTEKLIIYTNIEGYFFGGYKGNNGGFIYSKNYYTENILFNIGIKQKINLKFK